MDTTQLENELENELDRELDKANAYAYIWVEGKSWMIEFSGEYQTFTDVFPIEGFSTNILALLRAYNEED